MRTRSKATSICLGFPQLDLRGDKRFIFDTYVEVYLELVNSTLVARFST